MSTTSYIEPVAQDVILNVINSEWASLAPSCMRPQDDKFDDRKQTLASNPSYKNPTWVNYQPG